ncbi:MAG TPA: hypothetical protein VET23_12585 [Chitinophagaceae bacterium]|nr:hypothetical protein [Chitinophagaceae bacterium]
MKKAIIVLMLFISILPELCAQSNPKADKVFEVPENIIINRRFYINLDKGNKMEIEVSDLSDLNRMANIDSLLQIFLQDIAPLKDSLSDPLTAKRIDYVTDAQGRKKIRFQQFQPKSASFLINNGDLASLKTEQDTINIIGIIVNPPKPVEKISLTNSRYYHFTFYLNNMNELTGYMNGILAEKIKTIQNNIHGKWPIVLGSGFHYIKKDKTITADKPQGFTPTGTGDFLVANITVNVQNYKNYFVPSFSLGMRLTLTNRERTFKWEPGIFWEPHFLFARDNQNKMHTYRNDFLTFTYGQGGIKDYDPRKDFAFSAVVSLGYLINRNGDYFEKNTFRFGAGKLSISKTTIEPSLYFNNFFKGVTPGIRISQYF